MANGRALVIAAGLSLVLPARADDLDAELKAPHLETPQLGNYYTRDLTPIRGSKFQIPHDTATQVTVTRENTMKSACDRQVSSYELSGEVKAWVVDVEGDASSEYTVAVCRTVLTRATMRLNADVPDEVPKNAYYYVSTVVMGADYEEFMRGSASDIDAAISAKGLVGSGRVAAGASERQVELQTAARGLKEKAGAELFSAKSGDLADSFVVDEQDVVVLATLTPISTAVERERVRLEAEAEQLAAQQAAEEEQAAEAGAARLYYVRLLTVEFDAGHDWGETPDALVTVEHDGDGSTFPVVNDRQKAVFDMDIGNLMLGDGAPALHFTVADEDAMSNDEAGTATFETVTPGKNCAYSAGGEGQAQVCVQLTPVE